MLKTYCFCVILCELVVLKCVYAGVMNGAACLLVVSDVVEVIWYSNSACREHNYYQT